jgi:arsenite methyltransferase
MSRTVVDAADLERRVKDMYTQVALEPQARYHFEMGREFAGVGYYFGLANLRPGEHVVDLAVARAWTASSLRTKSVSTDR